MKIVTSFPHSVREIETCWITMSDGCRLAARIWLPESSETAPVPAVFEYIPYRRRDFTRSRDEPIHRYFAGKGYASLRIDIRGSGDSDGLQDDEYLEEEQNDALEVIQWIAEQPWCNGSLGMFGKSWGGINSLHVAARRPPALKSIISVCTTDDRYIDTDHYLGGCLTDVQMVWGSLFLGYLRRPPDPDVVGKRWREMWLKRLANNKQPMEDWFCHQRYDSFWKRGSVCEDYSTITCPVYIMGGWLDGFSNSIFRLLSGLKCPRKAMIGPWGHQYAHDGKPLPSTGFLQEAVRWWDQWLKGIDTGIMNEPMIRVWMQDSIRPHPQNPERPGRWVAEPSWPSPNIESSRYFLNSRTLDPEAAPETKREICSPQTVGLASNFWHAAMEDHQAADQREEDGGSLCFDSPPLPQTIEILGAPVVTLDLTSNRQISMVAVRLNDLAPDGSSLFVSFGVLNLTHREGHESPTALEPGKRYTVRIQLDEIAHSFPPGHSIRVAVSTNYWHRAWPMPEPVTLCVFTGASSLDLPVRPLRPEDPDLKPFGETESAPPMANTVLRPPCIKNTLERDVATRETVVTDLQDNGIYRIDDHGLEVENYVLDRYSIREDDPLSAKIETRRRFGFARGEWRVCLESHVVLTSTKESFHLCSKLEAFEGDICVDSKNWDTTFPRDLM